jgi:hypothetical protein
MTADWQDIFPSSPITGETAATVELVGNDWRSDEDWDNFRQTCKAIAATHGGEVDPANVRQAFADRGVDMNPRRVSAFYHRAASKNGFLDFARWGLNTDHKGRNAGRPARIYKLRSP